MGNKISLKDIAKKVGVSTALVSYVLNNRMMGRISKEVAQKIKETAAELNYRPNQIAKSLKTRKTFTIGLVVADIANPFFSNLARVIEDEAEKSHYTVIFGSSDEKGERSKKLVEVLLDRQVDGIILAATEADESLVTYLQRTQVPFVLVDRYFPGLNVNYVVINNFEAAFQATVHLVEAGYQRIGMIGFDTTLQHLQERKKGYWAALEEKGISMSDQWIREVSLNASNKEVELAIQQLLALGEPVDALFFASNKLSTYGLKYLNTLLIRVPNDVAVISFDESDATDLFYASLTHIRQPLQLIGQQAVSILLKNIGPEEALTQLQLQARLVIGKST